MFIVVQHDRFSNNKNCTKVKQKQWHWVGSMVEIIFVPTSKIVYNDRADVGCREMSYMY